MSYRSPSASTVNPVIAPRSPRWIAVMRPVTSGGTSGADAHAARRKSTARTTRTRIGVSCPTSGAEGKAPVPSPHVGAGLGAPRIGRVPAMGRGGRSVDAQPGPPGTGPDPPHRQRARGRRGVRPVGPDGAGALRPPRGRRRGRPPEASPGRRPARSPGPTGRRGGGVLLRREPRLPGIVAVRLGVLAVPPGEPRSGPGVRWLQRGGGRPGRTGGVAAPPGHVLARAGRVPRDEPGSPLGRRRCLPARPGPDAGRAPRATPPPGHRGRGDGHGRRRAAVVGARLGTGPGARGRRGGRLPGRRRGRPRPGATTSWP